eukprot:TRINITY_DN67553_c4_g1_i1.p1 TRINITY_DN67553_c4_g1~~TRINITY_DN67553_c4_g1_i1.p1  ORF type:complete len:540 (+),score=-18.26 TRINITY_DN67553_c4_g1_i1:105-1724(+)
MLRGSLKMHNRFTNRCVGRAASSRPLNFANTQISMKGKSNFELFRALFVFSICRIRPLVLQSEFLVRMSYKILGNKITDSMMKLTFFGHFCAGEDTKEITPRVHQLEDCGVGSILDYAAEADLISNPNTVKQLSSKIIDSKVKVRTYPYSDEANCDKHRDTFIECIRAAREASSADAKCFAAVKVTALGDPELLKTMSNTIIEFRKLYYRLNPENKPFLTRDDFRIRFNDIFESDWNSDELYDILDKNNDNMVDLADWVNNIPIDEIHTLITSHCQDKHGPLSVAVLNDEERELYDAMANRLRRLAEVAKENNVRVMIDAEQTYFQPAIDYLTHELMFEYNVNSYPVVFGTYQMYLKDSMDRLQLDIARAERYNYTFAAKLVRGAYMVTEAEYARENNKPSPIHNNLQGTHDNYNNALEFVINKIADNLQKNDESNAGLEIMFASHNQQSMELAVKQIQHHELSPPDCGIYFGQLLGMVDHLTNTLGFHKYRSYKYVPYGKVSEVMPYLIRRGVENSDALGGASKEIKMIVEELKRRLF